MAKDYYETLGVARDAAADAIKKAYRSLARKFHPDVQTGDKAEKKKAEDRFKEIQQAYDVLGDAEKRAAYDRMGHAAYTATGGKGQPHFDPSAWSGGGGPGMGGGPGGFSINLEDLFAQAAQQGRGGSPNAGFDPESAGGGGLFDEIFSRVRGSKSGRKSSKSSKSVADIEQNLRIPFLTAVQGGAFTFDVDRGLGRPEPITFNFPPGAKTGDRLRLRKKGSMGADGERGDLVLNLDIEPHPHFTRIADTRDLAVEVPITLSEAVLGAKVDVPTLSGLKSLTIPAGTSSGQRLRIKGQGIPPHKDKLGGDLFVIVKVAVPKSVDDASKELIREFAQRNPLEPRKGLW